jgi:hypothetical protein
MAIVRDDELGGDARIDGTRIGVYLERPRAEYPIKPSIHPSF